MEIWFSLLPTRFIPNFSMWPSHRRGTAVFFETYLSKTILSNFFLLFLHFKMLLEDFTHHNIDMACNLLEVCGRFLYRSPESHVRTRNLLVCSVLFNTRLWRSLAGDRFNVFHHPWPLSFALTIWHVKLQICLFLSKITDNQMTLLCERKPVVRQFNRKRIPKLLKGWTRLCSW